jgi:hypothetical protein
MALSSINDQCSAVLKCTWNAISVAVTFYTFVSKRFMLLLIRVFLNSSIYLKYTTKGQLNGQWAF